MRQPPDVGDRAIAASIANLCGKSAVNSRGLEALAGFCFAAFHWPNGDKLVSARIRARLSPTPFPRADWSNVSDRREKNANFTGMIESLEIHDESGKLSSRRLFEAESTLRKVTQTMALPLFPPFIITGHRVYLDRFCFSFYLDFNAAPRISR